MSELSDARSQDQRAELSRGDFLKWTAGAGVAAAATSAFLGGPAGAARSGPSAAQDKKILTYLLSLERLEVAWHLAAADIGLSSELTDYARTVAQQDKEHVDLLAKSVGDTGSSLPKIPDALSADRFDTDAVSLKEAVVAAYIGQSGNLTTTTVLDVARITAVEARHASWLRDIVGSLPAPSAADPASSQRQVTAVLRRLGLGQGV
jgi:Ferritin-like domain